ncbi:DUF4259 domain-containing protein [Actinomadura macra]|uniref:DUF4259 domain-containing protein n=1 Tax=Actinomadura macra TaxID=46164 RepID=UPI0008333A22|nr:DUF4259 domain-containing protein [Actinomadura macra]
MGAWGQGPFDNDTAMDFVGGLTDRPPAEVPGALRSAMASVLDRDDYLDSDEIEEALAAACLVTARLAPSVPLTGSVRKYLADLEFGADPDLRDLAVRVFVRAFDPSDNEWYELWTDGGGPGKIEAALAPYRAAVG